MQQQASSALDVFVMFAVATEKAKIAQVRLDVIAVAFFSN